MSTYLSISVSLAIGCCFIYFVYLVLESKTPYSLKRSNSESKFN